MSNDLYTLMRKADHLEDQDYPLMLNMTAEYAAAALVQLRKTLPHYNYYLVIAHKADHMIELVDPNEDKDDPITGNNKEG